MGRWAKTNVLQSCVGFCVLALQLFCFCEALAVLSLWLFWSPLKLWTVAIAWRLTHKYTKVFPSPNFRFFLHLPLVQLIKNIVVRRNTFANTSAHFCPFRRASPPQSHPEQLPVTASAHPADQWPAPGRCFRQAGTVRRVSYAGAPVARRVLLPEELSKLIAVLLGGAPGPDRRIRIPLPPRPLPRLFPGPGTHRSEGL